MIQHRSVSTAVVADIGTGGRLFSEGRRGLIVVRNRGDATQQHRGGNMTVKENELIELYEEGRRDFSRVNLGRADLSGINLSGASLTKADLSEAELNGAFLIGANMIGANLSKANLQGALLFGADLSEADLSEADLSEANLVGANLEHANVTDEQLSMAQSLQFTILPDGTQHGYSLGQGFAASPGASRR